MEKIISDVSELIDSLLRRQKPQIVAIDGRCASGKTTLATSLQKKYGCNVIHMDQFFLRPEQRTKERLQTPGENIDHERFLEEVLCPLREGENFTYRSYNCQEQQLSEPIEVLAQKITIIEGSYACHKSLWDYYDIKIFLSINPEEQLRRIIAREGGLKAEIFKEKWIPLEEKYFAVYRLKQRCDYCFDSSQHIIQ